MTPAEKKKLISEINTVYANLDGLTALAVAEAIPLTRIEDEKDTAFVKRIVAAYLVFASHHGAL
jgi:hypothetical protein